jgi:hypothetical protein
MASETAGAVVLIVVPNVQRVRWNADALWVFAQHVGGSTRARHVIRLVNGSRIEVVSFEQLEVKSLGMGPSLRVFDD